MTPWLSAPPLRATPGELAFRYGVIWAAILVAPVAFNGCNQFPGSSDRPGATAWTHAGAKVTAEQRHGPQVPGVAARPGSFSLCAPDGAPGDRAPIAQVDFPTSWRLRGSAESRVLSDLDLLGWRLQRGAERVAYWQGVADADGLARLHRKPVGRGGRR